jgi:transcription elongation factor SPT5
VFAKDLRAAAEVSSTQFSTGQYDLQDLVTLSPTEVGVIVKAEKDSYSILNQYGNIIKVRPQQIKSRRDSSRAVTRDRDNKPVTISDSVVVMNTQGSGVKKRAIVIHVYRSYIFLQSREVLENGGIFVTGSANVSIMNSSAGPQQVCYFYRSNQMEGWRVLLLVVVSLEVVDVVEWTLWLQRQ